MISCRLVATYLRVSCRLLASIGEEFGKLRLYPLEIKFKRFEQSFVAYGCNLLADGLAADAELIGNVSGRHACPGAEVGHHLASVHRIVKARFGLNKDWGNFGLLRNEAQNLLVYFAHNCSVF